MCETCKYRSMFMIPGKIYCGKLGMVMRIQENCEYYENERGKNENENGKAP